MVKRHALVAMALAVAAIPALAQGRFEVQPFVGYRFGGNIPVGANVFDFTRIKMENSVSGGVTIGYNATEAIGLEFLWNRQPTNALGVLPGGVEDPDKVHVNLDQYHGNVLLNLRDEREKLRPFILFGFGATRGDGAESSLTRFSFAVGGGIKYFFTEGMGLRLQARYAPTYLYSAPGGAWCNWWGACWSLPGDRFLQQGDVTAGWVFRF